MMIEPSWRLRTSRLWRSVPVLAPGLLVAGLVAIAAQFLADHHGSPAMLMALLLGISLNFLSEEGRCVQGVHFASRAALRFGIALLGARVSVELIVELGPQLIGIIIGAVLATIVFGVCASRLLGAGWRLGLLTGGAVGICGASAAMAIGAILAKTEDAERNLVFTVLGVTVLSTAAMLAYPLVAEFLGFDDRLSGVFIGATIHDVAQVVGAGFSVSDEAGEAATLVKLIRVTMLAPVVLLLAFVMHFGKPEDKPAGQRTAILPGFILAFALLAALNSAHLIPEQASNLAAQLSRWALLAAIAAVGMRTSLKQMLAIGGDAIVLILAETVFLAGLVIAGLHLVRG
jgi:uncharacterized integral membrane protein (TIGR00698 family)